MSCFHLTLLLTECSQCIFIIATQFHINDLKLLMIFQTQDDWNITYPIFDAMSTSPHCIINRGRTIAAPVDYEGILNMESSNDLPLATTSLANANSSSSTTLPSRSLSRWQAQPPMVLRPRKRRQLGLSWRGWRRWLWTRLRCRTAKPT